MFCTQHFSIYPRDINHRGVMSGERADHKSLLIILSWNRCSILHIEIGWQTELTNIEYKYMLFSKNINSLAIIQFTLTHKQNRASTKSGGDHNLTANQECMGCTHIQCTCQGPCLHVQALVSPQHKARICCHLLTDISV